MKLSRLDYLNILLIILTAGMTILFYDKFPDPVPTHWDWKGVADGFTAKPWGAFITPLMMAGIYLLFLFLPAMSPKGFRIESFAKVWGIIKLCFVLVMLLIHTFTSLAASGFPLSMEIAIPVVVGVMFVVLGNYLGKVSKNFFVGIRTPWTLANDEVWLHTHRLGGKLFVIGGLVMILASLLALPPWVALVALAIVTIVPVVYSYVLYRRIVGFKGNQSSQ